MESNFAEGNEEQRHEDLLRREDKLLYLGSHAAFSFSNKDAIRHMRHGFVLRHLMMQTSRIEVREESFKVRAGSLDPYTATNLAIHLNSFYLNLRGALDNLAWSISYEFGLKADLDESRKASRDFCYLFGTPFLRAIAESFPKLPSIIKGYKEWSRELSKFRDPAAHRLPLAFVSGVLSEEGRIEYYKIMQEAVDLLKMGDWKAYTERKYEAKNVAQFLPIMVSAEHKEHPIRIVPNQMAHDQNNFMRLATGTIKAIMVVQ